MRAIAEKANVSVMTVSLALRDHPSISAATKARVREIAQELNYRPDPILHAFHTYRRNSQSTRYQGTMAWVDAIHPSDMNRQAAAFLAYFEGARIRAQELGYQLDKFELSIADMTGKRMVDILRARNITGILLPPQPSPQASLDLDWSNFSVVTFGYTLVTPRFHSICHDHFQSMLTVIDYLRKQGYRRIGFAISKETNERVRKLWLACFLTEQLSSLKKDRLPPLLIKGTPTPDMFKDWVERFQPDAVIAIDPRIANTLKALGKKIPEEMGFAICGDAHNNASFPHINENSYVIGATAANLLASLLQHSEKGIPPHPQRVLIEGTWDYGTRA